MFLPPYAVSLYQTNSEQTIFHCRLDRRGKLCHCVSDDFGWRELKIQNGAFSSGEHTFREGWFLLEYDAGTRYYYRFYPVKYAAEQGDSWCNVGFLDEDELSEAAGQ